MRQLTMTAAALGLVIAAACGGKGNPSTTGGHAGAGGGAGATSTSSSTSSSSSGGVAGSGGSGGVDTSILPADRATVWAPGVQGGVPERTTVCATIDAASLGGGDATSTLQAALDACPEGQVVSLSAGEFRIDDDIVYLQKGVTLRGAGAGKTFLRRTNGAKDTVDEVGAAMPVIIVGQSRWTYGEESTALTADGAKGSTSITVQSTAGLAPGMLVLLDELSGAEWVTDPQGHGRQVWASPDFRTVWQSHNPALDVIDDPLPEAAGWFCRQDRPTTEIHEIAAVSGNTVTFTTPLHIDYRTSHSAEITHLGYAAVRGAGIEALTVSGGDDGEVRFVHAVESWARNIEVTTWRGEGVAIDWSHRIELRDSYLHDAAYSSPGGGAYAISIQGGSSEALIEDNIVVRANKVIVARSSGAGSVVGYNFMDQGFIDYAPGWQEMGVGGSHMVGPHHMLFEGNLSWNGDNDHTHGSSIYHTYFRNHLTGYRSSFTTNTGIPIDDLGDVPGSNGPKRCAGASAFSYWMSYVGNVLGLPGKMAGWTYASSEPDNAVWALGWENQFGVLDPDPHVAENILRNGNYDYLTDQVKWHGIGDAGAAPSPLPDSLYLKKKPAFFGSHAWPWVDPLGATKVQVLPAKERWDMGQPNGG